VSAVVVLHDLEGDAPALVRPVQKGAAVADVGGGHLDLADQAEGVDQQVALDALGLLARVIAGLRRAGPPFSADLTVWLSMIAALGLASRPSASRSAT